MTMINHYDDDDIYNADNPTAFKLLILILSVFHNFVFILLMSMYKSMSTVYLLCLKTNNACVKYDTFRSVTYEGSPRNDKEN